MLIATSQVSFQIDANLLMWLVQLILLGVSIYAVYSLAVLFKQLTSLVKGLEKSLVETAEHTATVTGNLVDLTDDAVEFTKPTLATTTEMLQRVADVVDGGADLAVNLLGVGNHLVSTLHKATSTFPDMAGTARAFLKTVKFVRKFTGATRSFKRK